MALIAPSSLPSSGEAWALGAVLWGRKLKVGQDMGNQRPRARSEKEWPSWRSWPFRIGRTGLPGHPAWPATFLSFQLHDEFANAGLSGLRLLAAGFEVGLAVLDQFLNPSIDLGLLEIVFATDVNLLAFFFEELQRVSPTSTAVGVSYYLLF